MQVVMEYNEMKSMEWNVCIVNYHEMLGMYVVCIVELMYTLCNGPVVCRFILLQADSMESGCVVWIEIKQVEVRYKFMRYRKIKGILVLIHNSCSYWEIFRRELPNPN